MGRTSVAGTSVGETSALRAARAEAETSTGETSMGRTSVAGTSVGFETPAPGEGVRVARGSGAPAPGAARDDVPPSATTASDTANSPRYDDRRLEAWLQSLPPVPEAYASTKDRLDGGRVGSDTPPPAVPQRPKQIHTLEEITEENIRRARQYERDGRGVRMIDEERARRVAELIREDRLRDLSAIAKQLSSEGPPVSRNAARDFITVLDEGDWTPSQILAELQKRAREAAPVSPAKEPLEPANVDAAIDEALAAAAAPPSASDEPLEPDELAAAAAPSSASDELLEPEEPAAAAAPPSASDELLEPEEPTAAAPARPGPNRASRRAAKSIIRQLTKLGEPIPDLRPRAGIVTIPADIFAQELPSFARPSPDTRASSPIFSSSSITDIPTTLASGAGPRARTRLIR
jgi:hypothetical protein